MKKNVYFRYDVMDAKIVGSKSAFDMANRGYGDAYEELMRMSKEYPDFGYQVTKRKSSQDKNTYKGLTRAFIINYLDIQDDKETVNKEFEKVESMATKKWPEVKKWFLSKYPDFSVEDAKWEIAAAAGFIYLLRPRWHRKSFRTASRFPMPTTHEQPDFAHAKSFDLCSFQSTKSVCSTVYKFHWRNHRFRVSLMLPPKSVCLAWDSPFRASAVAKGITH